MLGYKHNVNYGHLNLLNPLIALCLRLSLFDSEIKNNLLQYAQTTMLFSAANVDSNVISWNRVVLLHGKLSETPSCQPNMYQQVQLHSYFQFLKELFVSSQNMAQSNCLYDLKASSLGGS